MPYVIGQAVIRARFQREERGREEDGGGSEGRGKEGERKGERKRGSLRWRWRSIWRGGAYGEVEGLVGGKEFFNPSVSLWLGGLGQREERREKERGERRSII